MSAEIIQFLPRTKQQQAPAGLPGPMLRSTTKPEDPAMGQVDTAPCEYIASEYSQAQFPDA